MAARRSKPSRSRNSRSSTNVFTTAIKNPRKAGHEVMDAATMGMERVGRTLELVADFAQRAGAALNDVGESLLRASKDIQPTTGRGSSTRTTNGLSRSTNGSRKNAAPSSRRNARGGASSARGRRGGGRTGSRSNVRSGARSGTTSSDASAPFAGVGA